MLLLSCAPKKEVVSWNLLPKPQQVNLYGKQKHRLTNGKIAPSLIREIWVSHIPEAFVNPEEAYRLRITKDSVMIEAVTGEGFYRARQTLNQLVASSGGHTLPALEITDWPAFRVRGFMHDVGRSFISVEELKKQITLLSQFKINVFHWHLTENQGWRLESKRYPQLNDSSNFSRLPGQFYTIEDAREIAAHCRAHHMLLIPEIDMPGHSAAFVRATGVDMQSEEGMKILKDLMDEICTEVFPELPWIHIGTDEVQFTNPSFVPEMVAYIRSLGKKVISWNPGWKYQSGEIDATQLWSYRGKAQPGIPAIDSRFHYINHFDVFGDIVALYNSRIYNADHGSDDLAGSILAVWNDRVLPHESDILLQNSFFPHMLALAERSWLGGGSEYFDKNGVILPTDESDDVFKSFADFERRMLWHKEHTFAGEPFPYVQQTQVKWLITDPFPNGGVLDATFPPDSALSDNYSYNGKNYGVRPATGAGIYLRHVWGNIVPAFFENPQENHTAYAYTRVWSTKDQTVGLRVSTQEYSRSENDLPPPQGEWDYRRSRIFVNDSLIDPPVWENRHTTKTNEVTLKNENFTARPPIAVHLKKGWNKVLLKLPVGKFSTPEVRLQKWMFTFVFVTLDGEKAVSGLIYDPSTLKE
ncbi:MAG: beta-N-acetylhexosaminidase [Porphyromonadaceae bacterium]|nr:beta-N-acetylhexosaminidase [Porphyromonadaceae bacterium]